MLTNQFCAWPEGEHGAAIQTTPAHQLAEKTWLHAPQHTACRHTDAALTANRQLSQATRAKARCLHPEHPLHFISIAAPPSLPACSPRPLLTFVLSHVFVLPGAAEQHQPHSPTDTELRERASRPLGRRITGVSAHHSHRKAGPAPVLSLCFPAAPHAAFSRTFLRRFIQERR